MVCVFIPVTKSMRKRKYGHLQPQDKIEDFMIEDIENYYQYKKQNPDMAENAVESEASIHNLVGTAKISCSSLPLNLHIISRVLPNSSYYKQKFAAITIRLGNPICTCLLFTSGKMVLTGCRTYIDCIFASHLISKLLQTHVPGVSFNLRSVRIQNIVGNVDMNLKNQEMDLNRLHQDKSIFCTYQKNMFPGLIYRPNDCPVVLLIFTSGKIVITGGKTTKDIKVGWELLKPFIQSYIKSI